ncbi:hypothetical protein [Paenibacillus hexagrammi]|uniref:Uncharacterized protein n=1 Tax=Paenibacillus hexagrammi TaxID=2908839 RepID=A0ABY3SP71_9BACL|nr:hypothetical protein [Paenibacillus sp. YPD9-1]UJF34891.1 hypothetical protein L0M14_07000 [Paenibacillus sp. YPD9-1]
MEAGFEITCIRCGCKQLIVPGVREFRNEPITFGTDNYGADHVACECGNAIEEMSRFEENHIEREFIVEWRDISK